MDHLGKGRSENRETSWLEIKAMQIEMTGVEKCSGIPLRGGRFSIEDDKK